MRLKSFAFALLITALVGLCACTGKKSDGNVQTAASPDDSTLIVYYSQTGATKAVADELQKHLGCDITAIEAVNPYDGDYSATIARWRSELESGVKPEIKPLAVSLDNYKRILLCFPIWGGTYALPVATFLADNSLDGKTVVTFATFGSGGIDKATADVAAAQPGAEVTQGYGVRNARIAKAPAEITRFLIENGFIDGEVTPLPEYSEAVAVTDNETAIFDAAYGNYQFPLGTPVMVAKRITPTGTDYRFDVKSQTPDSKESTSTIYVTITEGETPEFTQVIRH